MEPAHDSDCRDLLLDLISYERCRGHLSPEMEYLLERHMERCLSCRRVIRAFRSMVRNNEAVANFG